MMLSVNELGTVAARAVILPPPTSPGRTPKRR
jgi:hypothetical protein